LVSVIVAKHISIYSTCLKMRGTYVVCSHWSHTRKGRRGAVGSTSDSYDWYGRL